MAKNKLAKFAEMETLENVFQPTQEEVFRTDYKLKGKWGEQVFGNDHPIVLEVGCGKGEYSVGLGELYPEKNFIGRTGIHFRSRRNFRNMDHLSRPANGKSPQASHGNPFPFPISKILKRERAHSFENRQSFPLSIHGRAGENQSSTRDHQHGRSLRKWTG